MSFIESCIVKPLIEDSGYNVCNTIIYFSLLALFLIYAVPPILKKLNIKFDMGFITGLVIYSILGSVLRSLEDLGGKFDLIILRSPLIWILMLTTGFLTYYLSKFIGKKINYSHYKIWHYIGIFLILLLLINFPFSYFYRIFTVLLIILIWLVPIFILNRFKLFLFDRKEIYLPIAMHLLDASVTYAAINFYGYGEKHVVPSFFIKTISPVMMFPLKILIIIPAVYLIYRYFPEDKIYYLTLIGLFGLITGMRDLITLLNL